ncbi:hypothetical protein CBS101457_006542 [Exobasidium rhododendri]|nr:hypothetical protein CBS101457_006542 [Exobasidium rhododendri]
MLRRKLRRDDSSSTPSNHNAAGGQTHELGTSKQHESFSPPSSSSSTTNLSSNRKLYSSSNNSSEVTPKLSPSLQETFPKGSPATAAYPQSRQLPNSNSVDGMEQFSSSSNSQGGAFYQYPGAAQSVNAVASTSIGRSQSAFNFIFSKAKASFSSSSQQHHHQHQNQNQHQLPPSQEQHQQAGQRARNAPMNPSASISSLNNFGSGSPGEETFVRPRELYQQGGGSIPRSSTSDFDVPRYRSTTQGQSSFGDEPTPVSSPTKRSIFGGSRERKASIASIGKGGSTLASAMGITVSGTEKSGTSNGGVSAASRPQASHSPLSRSYRGEVLGQNYGQFSKSQSDIQMKSASDFSSPTARATDVPPVPHVPASIVGKAKASDKNLLQSPTAYLGFSKSVDDLSRHPSPDLKTSRSNSSSHDALPVTGGTWGELGVPEAGESRRASDTGAMVGNQLTSSGSFGQGGIGQIPFSSAPIYQNNPTQQNTAWPQMSLPLSPVQNFSTVSTSSSHISTKEQGKASRMHLNRRDQVPIVPSQKMPPPTLSTSSQSSHSTRPLPFGVDHEGFLNRNVNITLPLAQLVDSGGSRGKEKDIAKGWKPYKVLLREGKLFFYKPTGTIADEVKSLFIASPTGQDAGLPNNREAGISLEELIRNKVGSTQELLAATSRGTMDRGLPTRLPLKRANNSNIERLSAIADDQEDDAALSSLDKGRGWERAGKHQDLILSEEEKEPTEWRQRVEGGSIEALAHEFVFATQMNDSTTSTTAEAEGFLYSIIVAIHSSQLSLRQYVAEVDRWTRVRLKSERTAENTRHNSLEDPLKARIRLLTESDIVNMVSNREETLNALETLIQTTWAHDDVQAEAQLANVLTCDPWQSGRDWIGPSKERSSELTKFASILRASALLSLEPGELARQIHLYTSAQLDRLQLPPDSLFRLVNRDLSETVQLFSFDWTRPHFLTRLVLDHLLQPIASLEGAGSGGGGGGGGGAGGGGGGLHGAKLRASLLRHWIAVASYLLKLNNFSAWLSICVALCSRFVARLGSSWRFVASNDRALVSSVWAPILVQMGWSDVAYHGKSAISSFLHDATSIKASMSQVILHKNKSVADTCALPYFGNSLLALLQPSGRHDSNNLVSIVSLQATNTTALDILALTRQWRTMTDSRPIQEVPNPDKAVQRALQALSTLNQASKDIDLSRMLELSLHLEGPSLGKVDTRSPMLLNRTTAGYAASPLLFPQSLPNLSLLEKETVDRLIANTDKIGERSTSEGPRLSPSKQPSSSPFDAAKIVERNNGSRPALHTSASSSSKHRSMTLPSRQPSRDVPFASIVEWSTSGPVLNDDNLLKIGSDLVMWNVPDQVASPSALTANKRFSQEISRSSRPVSQISKRSSLPASNRNSVVDPPTVHVQVTVKSASLERLVDVLVLGVQHITLNPSDDNLETSLTPPKRFCLNMDLASYRKTFLATYRSFCASNTLFDLLQIRFKGAIRAGRELGLAPQHRSFASFPSWSVAETVSASASAIDWEVVLAMRSGVTNILTSWIAQYPQDFTENDALYRSVHYWVAEVVASTTVEDDSEWEKCVASLYDVLNQLQTSVMTCCIQPVERRAVKRSSKRVSRANAMQASSRSPSAVDESTLAAIDFDEATPHQLIDYLESVARVFFEKIEDKDLLMASELFQSRCNDPMAWFIAKNSSSSLASQHPDEMPHVNNMYKLLELIRWPRDGPSISHRLAATIRDACAAQNLLRGWIAIHIIESRIGLAKRQARIEKLLDAVWICRARMFNSRLEEPSSSSSSSPLSAAATAATPSVPPKVIFQEPTIASFVECLIVGSLTSSESRLFTRAWQGVAEKRKGNCDSLSSLYPSEATAEAYREAKGKTCTPDIGWILKTMAEVMTKRDLEVMEEGQDSSLVDFEKFRTMHNFIESSVSFYNKGKSNALDPELVELAGARLTAMQSALRNVTWERRAFKEDAAQEALTALPPSDSLHSSIMKGARPLSDITALQQEKHRRDRRALELLEYIQHTKRTQQAAAAAAAAAATAAAKASSVSEQSPQSRSSSSPPFVASVGSSTGPLAAVNAASASTSEKKTRRMTALFRGAVRPMGLMSSSVSTEKSIHSNVDQHHHLTHSTAELLSLTPTQKSSLVLNCGSSVANVWNNGQRNHVFHLSLAEGGHVLLQATSQKEMVEWCSIIEKTSKSFAVPNAAYLQDGSGSKGKGSQKKGGAPSVALYGTELQRLVDFEKRTVPLGLVRMLEEVEARGLREQGIYRISGAKNAIELLKLAFSKQSAESIDLAHGDYSDIHTIAGAIKQWFRELPEPAVPFAFYHRIIEAEKIEDEEERLYTIRDLVWDFPAPHFNLLKRISQHLSLICEEGEYNLMAPHNIGLVFGTSLLNPPPGPSSVAESFGNIGKAAHIVKIILTMHDWLFEPEPEPEPEPETEPDIKAGAEAELEPESEAEEIVTNDDGPEKLREELESSSQVPTESDGYEEEQQQRHLQELVDSEIEEGKRLEEEESTVISSSTSQTIIPGQGSGFRNGTIPSVTLDSPPPTTTPATTTAAATDHIQASTNGPEQVPSKEVGDAVKNGGLGAKEVSNRDRMLTDSVYLDATDAIAVLLDPFEEEDDASEE